MREVDAYLASALVTKEGSLVSGSRVSELVGRLLYLEGHEYLMYNTYDVHHYGTHRDPLSVRLALT